LDRENLTETDVRDPSKVLVSMEGPADAENWEQEEDVLDTWASSWIWPLATLGWPDSAAMEKAGFRYYYPTATLVTGPDIIFFWVARMIMAGLEFSGPRKDGRLTPGEIAGRIPFRDVYFTGIIRDAQGRKMSKSLGNSPDPLDLIAKYGADGLRFGIISIAPQGQDIRFQEDRIEGGKNFCNKLWNAARFRQMSGPMGDNSSLQAIVGRLEPDKFDADDETILEKLRWLEGGIGASFETFEFAEATQRLYTFFWNDFCDWYVEVSKTKLQSPDTKGNCLAIQDLVLRQSLLLLHPIIPFITEELWQILGYGSGGRFIEEYHPGFEVELLAKVGRGFNADAIQSVIQLQQFVSQARALKAGHNLASRRDVRFFVTAADVAWEVVQANHAYLSRMAGAAGIERRESVDGAPAVVTPLGTLYLDLASAVDPAAERKRLGAELEKLAKHIAGTEARLAKPAFAGKAPPAVLAGAERQLAELVAKRAEIERLLAGLGSV
jgi:valyl-tRNA synthetase